MHVNVLFFAQAKDKAGTGRSSLSLNDDASVADAIKAIQAEHPSLVELWPHLAVAVDGVLANEKTKLHDGAELALLPPVSGG